jgi:hypothetical protein
MRIYLDGFAYGDTLSASNFPWNSAAPLTIGARESFSTPLATEEFTGKIDEVRIWKTVRSQVQIQQNMHNTLGPTFYNSLDSGLIAYWRFGELEDLGIGGDGADDIRDYSANQLHGDLMGDATLDTSGVILDIFNLQSNPPKEIHLCQNYPNPFNPSTTIEFNLLKTSEVSLKVFNILGEEVATLVSDRLSAGSYSYEWDASNLSSGEYLYRLQAGDYVETRKMVLMR